MHFDEKIVAELRMAKLKHVKMFLPVANLEIGLCKFLFFSLSYGRHLANWSGNYFALKFVPGLMVRFPQLHLYQGNAIVSLGSNDVPSFETDLFDVQLILNSHIILSCHVSKVVHHGSFSRFYS